jgi:hypothetical protein
MSAELQWTFRTADASPRRYYPQQFADSAMKATARFWFVVAVASQLLFAFTVDQ